MKLKLSTIAISLFAGLSMISMVNADEVTGLITKKQFDEIFPLSNGEHLKSEYTNAYKQFKGSLPEYAAAAQKCQKYEDMKDWPGQEKCFEENAPNYRKAVATLDDLAGKLQNCPAIMVVDNSGKKVDFSGEKPDPSTIKSIKTLYTYENFAKTTPYFPGFLSMSKGRHNAKRELAALLANVQQETTGLCFASETPFDILEKLNSPNDFSKITNQQLAAWMNDDDKKALAAQGVADFYSLNEVSRRKVIDYVLSVKKPKGKYCKWDANPQGEKDCLASANYYYGRGAIQLSYPYNYIAFGNTDFVKKQGYDLLMHPGLVADPSANQESRSSLLWGSAIWFWITPQAPKPSAHDVMTNQWQPTEADIRNGRQPGFGTVINIINGGLECGSSRGADKDVKAQNRIDAYKRILRIIGSSEDDNSKYPLDCKNSKNFNYQ